MSFVDCSTISRCSVAQEQASKVCASIAKFVVLSYHAVHAVSCGNNMLIEDQFESERGYLIYTEDMPHQTSD